MNEELRARDREDLRGEMRAEMAAMMGVKRKLVVSETESVSKCLILY